MEDIFYYELYQPNYAIKISLLLNYNINKNKPIMIIQITKIGLTVIFE